MNADPSAAAEPLSGTVLYIEDDPVAIELVTLIAGAHEGVNLVHATNGADGVRMAHECQPDFVLLDMHLPDISGLEVVRQLSELVASRNLRVTILTGDQLTMDIIKAMSLGAYEYWIKPLSPRVFESGLRRALTGKRADPRRTLR